MIVGITGFKGSGKSTVANVFTQHGYAYKPFAGPLKAMLMALLLGAEVPQELAVRALYGDLKESPMESLGGRTARHAMQTLGTEWGRDLISPSLWTDAWKRSVGHRPLVVTLARRSKGASQSPRGREGNGMTIFFAGIAIGLFVGWIIGCLHMYNACLSGFHP